MQKNNCNESIFVGVKGSNESVNGSMEIKGHVKK